MRENDLTENIHICEKASLITPKRLKKIYHLTYMDQKKISSHRNIIMNIIHKRDPRLLVICGPCSIHDIKSAVDYATRLKNLSKKLKDQLYIVMRVYLEKPRTTIGWKGMINDPYMDGSCNIEYGLRTARCLLLKLINIDIPLATEILNPCISQYIGEFFSWFAIGARTTESQIHREIASGLCTPVGFKNSTNGNLLNAIHAIKTAMMQHYYVGIGESGTVRLIHTRGNDSGHIILRGGENPNYSEKDIVHCEQEMMKYKLLSALMIDCSHGNSNKDYRFQENVVRSIVQQIKNGNRSIIGLMLESNIFSGNQSIHPLHSGLLKYGVSVTDSCIDWETTEFLLSYLYEQVQPFLVNRLLGVMKE